MKNDIVMDLAIEKVRMDFGDFISSLFRIILIKRNCFFNQIISIFSNFPYKVLRVGIITLFQHNLILLENFRSSKNLIGQKIHLTKISAVVSEAIYRIRYPRFTSLIEYDYGFYGSILFRFFLKSGQLYLSRIMKKILFESEKTIGLIEDILIHLARDRLIIKSNNCSFDQNSSVSFFYKKKLYFIKSKPTLKNSKNPWKISSSGLNFRLKLNILFSLLQEYQNFQTKQIMKFYLSKLLSFDVLFCNNIWFSIDSLLDICQDEIADKISTKKLLDCFTENLYLSDPCIKIKKNFYKIDLIDIQLFFQEKLIENIITHQFGKKFGIIFNIMSGKKIQEEQEILNKSRFNFFHTKTILYNMHRMGFVFLEDFRSTQKVSKNFRFWKLDLSLIIKRLISGILKSNYNLFIRLENYVRILNKLFFGPNKKDFDFRNNKNVLLGRVKMINNAIRRNDELLSILYL